ncbi:uncharacterized protein LOC131946061 [Physella acuta]|uniref:uncharacterized protein LOC131946061 n=1 Tax=Physella acuta TaxID=109671 RepID=UPI0027DAD1AF|nr:uncharacterized protein LOC131946061 [Physella acuta]XP_059162678.1 uncharacterized protein LOC131946061 [Physella acuta]XP_059162679.1 uncharacterized protein LOC131946061 [Physella acuta]XP_059162680.1 uncharacterized protein LOC131946061 [Physella acuta]
MASQSEEKRATFVKQRLETLLTEKATLYEKIDQHVKMVEDRTNAWMNNPGSSLESYLDICSLLETAVDSISQKADCFSEPAGVGSLPKGQCDTSFKTRISDDKEANIFDRLKKLEMAMYARSDIKSTIQEEFEQLLRDQNIKVKTLVTQLNHQSQSIKRIKMEINSLNASESHLNQIVENLAIDTETQFQDVMLKYGVVCQLFQQRLYSMDKLIELFNQKMDVSKQTDENKPQTTTQ